MFSTRVPGDRLPNDLARALAAARARGPVLDLTVSNPTRVNLPYPDDLLAPLSDTAALTYQPSPLGLRDAREAIADSYAQRGVRIDAEQVVLTASTSEAYSLLFKLLCDPGAAVLTPVPGYPLFDHLTRLEGVAQQRYALEYHGVWTADFDQVDRHWTPQTRAVLAVSPNNPTGSIVRDREADGLVGRCADRGAALILDEVFADYPLRDRFEEPAAFSTPSCLLCRLGGLSKSVGLPQVKLGWIALDGPAAVVDEALDRLEFICDTYLSVSTPVQIAARSLIGRGSIVRDRILERVRLNYDTVQNIGSGARGITALPVDGGWSAVLRVPATRSEEQLVLQLIERDAVAVHPGYFFDFPHEAFLVVSLLAEPDVFARGLQLVQDRIDAA